ncbi:peptide chain release factor 1 [Candidatus Woesearchaeota archaeon]|nr:peptide chain release factor 1 [Candidatus Woesearchaeota archaeon]
MQKLSPIDRVHIKKFVKELERYRGRHTELVTVYVPAGYDLNKVIQQLQSEAGTATNIKSSQTRNAVLDALERMIQHLKLIGKTPKNGVMAFSGNISDKEGVSDVRVWSFEPPTPLNQRLYRCDKIFVLDWLKDLMLEHETFGLVVLDRRDATLALLKGKSIVPLVTTHSQVPGKFKAGGQSSQRFSRLREEAYNEHFKKVADYMKDQFLPIITEIKGIIVGGPSVTVNDFLNTDHITGDVRKKIIATKDLSYTGDFGLQELLEKSADVLAAEEVAEEKQIVQKFLHLLATKPGAAAYGIAEVEQAVTMGAADIVLLSESLDDDTIERFEELAAKFGTQVRVISVETREGAQLRDIGKIAAILRYELVQG